MFSRVALSRLILALKVLFLSTKAFTEDTSRLENIQDASGMFNERGYLKSNSFSLSGNEVINDFNGNLIYTQRLFYVPLSENGIHADLKLCYNGNVSHTAFGARSGLNGIMQTPINLPEWIISVNGVAVQTFNFENELVTWKADTSFTADASYTDDIAAHIEGYHKCYRRRIAASGATNGVISIMMEDGSIKELYSLDTGIDGPAFMIGGEYSTCSKDDADRGYLWGLSDPQYGYFTLFKADGTQVKFQVYQPTYRTNLDCSEGFPKSRIDYPRILLPVSFSDQMGHVLSLHYAFTFNGANVLGRPFLDAIGEIQLDWDDWNFGTTGGVEFTYDGSSLYQIYFADGVHTPHSSGRGVSWLPSFKANRGQVWWIIDPALRNTEFRYRTYRRTFTNMNFDVASRQFNVCDAADREAGASYTLQPWRIWNIRYPDGGHRIVSYLADPATAWGENSEFLPRDTITVSYDHTDNCMDGLTPQFPCRKSAWFDLLGRDPFFLNMVAAARQIVDVNQIVNTDTLTFSWSGCVDGDCHIKLNTNFITDRWFGKDSLDSPHRGDEPPVLQRKLTYRYFPENGLFSKNSRDRGWSLKMIGSQERDPNAYGVASIHKGYFWDIDTTGGVCSGTFQLDSLITTDGGVSYSETYEYDWLGDPTDVTVNNLVRRDVTDPWGIRSENYYRTVFMELSSPSSSYYNSRLLDSVRTVRSSDGRRLRRSTTQYYGSASPLGYIGQLARDVDYLLDKDGIEYDSTVSSYAYIKGGSLDPKFFGATAWSIDPRQDTTFYQYPAASETITRKLLTHDGTVVTETSAESFTGAGPSWFKMERHTGRETLLWYRKVDDRGRLRWLVEPNGYRSEVIYDNLNRVEVITLPGGYTPPGTEGDTAWSVRNVYDDEFVSNPVSVTQHVRVDKTRPSLSDRVWFDGLSRGIRLDALNADETYDSTLTGYDYAGREVFVVDRLGHRTLSNYDYRDRKTAMIFPDPALSTSRFEYKVITAGELGLTSLFSFPNSLIRGIKTINENSDSVWEYSDVRGKLRLRQTFDGSTPLSTYFDYDDLGNLTRVIKPMGDEVRYRYDSFGRLIEESSADLDSNQAGAPYGRITYEYDKNGNLIRRQDPMLRLPFGPAYTVKQYFAYDGLDREAESGFELNFQGSFTLVPMRRLFYDQAASSNSRGRLSLSWEFDFGKHCHYAERYHYDPRGRIVRQVDYFHAVLDSMIVPGHPELTTFTAHGDSLTLLYTYDWADQLKSITYPDGSAVKYGYDARGRLTAVGGAAAADSTKYAQVSYTPRDQLQIVRLGQGLQQLDYAYNERGWLKSINNGTSSPAGAPSDVFGEQIYYDDFPNPPSGVVPQYNGNLQGQTISVNGGANTFSYRYDESDRLKIKHFGEYALESFTYDANGNIATQLDWLGRIFNNIYHAGTNKLTVVDMLNAASDDTLAYDYNGNVASLSGKKAAFHHDVYGRMYAASVEIPYGIDSVHHAYSATGDRIYKRYFHPYRVDCSQERSGEGEGGEEGEPTRPPSDSASLWCMEADTTATYYVWGQGKILAEYRRPYAGAVHTNFIYAGASRIALRDSLNQLAYYLHDHLGSTSVVLDSSGTVRSGYLYSAFGLSLAEIGGSPQSYRYTGKPLDREAGLNLYWYGARFYDPKLGRFLALDPAAGKYPGLSPYAYCANNPLKNLDPDGAVVETGLDVASVVLSAVDMYNDPSWSNAGWLALDVASAIVPFVPAAGIVRHGSKVVDAAKSLLGADNAVDAAKVAENGLDAGTDASKLAEGPKGRHGKMDHRNAISKEASRLEGEGHTIDAGGGGPEKRVNTPGGKSAYRYPDIESTDPAGGKHYTNVGRTNQSGKPLPREQNALQDLENTGKSTHFVPIEK